jgi:hypothetical protein
MYNCISRFTNGRWSWTNIGTDQPTDQHYKTLSNNRKYLSSFLKNIRKQLTYIFVSIIPLMKHTPNINDGHRYRYRYRYRDRTQNISTFKYANDRTIERSNAHNKLLMNKYKWKINSSNSSSNLLATNSNCNVFKFHKSIDVLQLQLIHKLVFDASERSWLSLFSWCWHQCALVIVLIK